MDAEKTKTSTFENAAGGKAFVNAERHKFDLIDLESALEVEFQIDSDGRKVWVNIDGKCAVRVGSTHNIKIIDDRPPIRG